MATYNPPGGGGAPTGSAGGDLGGTYPNPTVVKIGDVTPATSLSVVGATSLASVNEITLANIANNASQNPTNANTVRIYHTSSTDGNAAIRLMNYQGTIEEGAWGMGNGINGYAGFPYGSAHFWASVKVNADGTINYTDPPKPIRIIMGGDIGGSTGTIKQEFASDGTVVWYNNGDWGSRVAILTLAPNGEYLNVAGRILLGGDTSSFPAIKRNGTGVEVRLADDSAYAPLRVSIATIQGLVYSSGSVIGSTADGNLVLWNSGFATFGMVKFGGETTSFPAIKRNGAALEIRLADDSGTAQIICKLPASNPGPGILWNDGGTPAIGT